MKQKGWIKFVMNNVPPVCGIYTLFSGGKLAYVGTSQNIQLRLLTHTKIRQFLLAGIDEIRFIEWDDSTSFKHRSQRYRMEGFLIYRHRPLLNKEKLSKRRLAVLPWDIPNSITIQ